MKTLTKKYIENIAAAMAARLPQDFAAQIKAANCQWQQDDSQDNLDCLDNLISQAAAAFWAACDEIINQPRSRDYSLEMQAIKLILKDDHVSDMVIEKIKNM
mgnify:CR=1 FL=1